MEKPINPDLTAELKQHQLHQLQAILTRYKQTETQGSVETDIQALTEAITHLEAKLREFEVELNSLNA